MIVAPARRSSALFLCLLATLAGPRAIAAQPWQEAPPAETVPQTQPAASQLPDAPGARPAPAQPKPLPAAPAQPAQTPAPQPAAPQPEPTTQPAPTTQTAPALAAPQSQTSGTPGLQPRPADQSPADPEPTTTFRIESNEVNLIFTVTDKKGRFVTGLHRENFGLLDDGRPPVAVIGFRQQTDLPLRVGVVIDTSSSIRTRFQFEQDSATEFFLQIMHRNDRAFVEGFDIQTNLAQDYTNSVDALNQGVHKLRPGGGTALYDSLYKTCRDQMLTLRGDEAIRKVLILVSDGDDNYSRSELPDAIKMCQRAETIVYAISTNLSPTKDKGDQVLQAISDATGGRTFYPNKIEDVANGFHAIEQELRSQYSLQYRPANFVANGAFRTIYLQALDSRYITRARKGYFAPRPAQ